MPRPVVKVLDGFDVGSLEYATLPVVAGNLPYKPMTSRWTFTEEERAQIAAGGDIWVTQLTFGNGLQPILIRTEQPTLAECLDVQL